MKKIIKISLFITIMFMSLFITSTVKAATATITADNKEVEVGGKVTLSININAASWSLTASGDGIATKKYADVTSDGMVENKTETITLDTSKEGPKTISLKGTVSEPSGEGTKKTDVDTSVTVTVKAKAQQENPSGGNNGNTNNGTTTQTPENPPKEPEPKKVKLTSLKINSTTYIKQLKTNLSATVEGQEDITLRPETSDGSSCTITNSTNGETYTVKSKASQKVKLNEGTNRITVKGKFDETYTVTVTNKKKEEETEPNVMEEPKPEEVKVILKSLNVKGVKLATEENEEEEKIDLILTPEFSSEVYEYTLNIPEEQNDITKLDIEAIGDKEDFTIEITGNENLVDGENIITILVKSKDGEKIATYQIKVIKEAKVVEAVTTPVLDVTPNTATYDETKDLIKVAIAGGVALISIVGIVFIVIQYKYGNKKEDDDEDIRINTKSFASVGFENENEEEEDIEEDILEDYKENTHIEDEQSLLIDETKKDIKDIKVENNRKNKAKREKKKEEFEDVEDTFEILKEDNTPSRKKGKHF